DGPRPSGYHKKLSLQEAKTPDSRYLLKGTVATNGLVLNLLVYDVEDPERRTKPSSTLKDDVDTEDSEDGIDDDDDLADSDDTGGESAEADDLFGLDVDADFELDEAFLDGGDSEMDEDDPPGVESLPKKRGRSTTTATTRSPSRTSQPTQQTPHSGFSPTTTADDDSSPFDYSKIYWQRGRER
ncbi:hypothetical protein BGX23_004911, partial [Mortierella sp. AD031]